jgi:glycosyltransferase involved in cell wall biosynthesis
VVVPPIQASAVEPTLLFIGNYVYPPNVEAADFLVREVWPRVQTRHPDARLLIAGSYTERIPALAGRPAGVEVLGFVDDLAGLYQRTRVVCCPIRVAGGTRVKIVEAAAFGKPVVSTTVGAEGLDFRDGEEILLRDDPEALAEACSRLLADPGFSERMGIAARAAVSRRYDRAATVARIRDLIVGRHARG